MDLSEVRAQNAARHPWELARADAITTIIGRHRARLSSVLDYGCGDGFTGQIVRDRFQAASLLGFDVGLKPEECGTRVVEGGTLALERDEVKVGDRRFELVLLCDVIEHVEDDVGLLAKVAERWLAADGLVMVTVPAFQALFTDHDRVLKHHRRYDAGMLARAAHAAGLERVEDGFLFGSLLPLRALAKLGEPLLPRRPLDTHGIGGWTGGPLITSALRRFLDLDNRFLLRARRLGLRLPGLSAWMLCTRR
jgi:hypothetical protein